MKKIIIGISIAVVIAFMALGVVYYIVNLPHSTEFSASMPRLDSDIMTVYADLIVSGKVSDVLDPKWKNPDAIHDDNNPIFTDIVIAIDDIHKGTPYDAKQILVRNYSGRIGLVSRINDMYPDFKKGEEVLLFLSKDKSANATNENYYILTGGQQAKYIIDNSNPKEVKFTNGPENIIKADIKKNVEYRMEQEKIKSLKPSAQELEENRKNNEKLFGKD